MSLGGFWRGAFRALDAIFRTADAALCNASGVERAAHDVITHTGQIYHTATAHEHDGVSLKVITFMRNVSDDFKAIRQTYLGHFAHGRVRLFGRTGHHLDALATAERRVLQSRCFGLAAQFRTS